MSQKITIIEAMGYFIRFSVVSLFLFLSGQNLLAQHQVAVVADTEGNKVFLRVDPILLRGDLDTLFSNIQQLGDDIDNLSWADVLENGTTPGVDVNFFGYDALGLGHVTTTGTFTGDSLVLAKDATIAGRLSVTGVSSLSDSLTVAGFVSLGDSLEVVRAVSIGETLYVTGVTSLGDSLHVAGNVNMAQLLNVVGAATFESTVDVDGETTLNDTLHVNAVTLLNDSLHVVGGADFDSDVNVDGNGAIGGTLGVTGATSLGSTLAVTGVTSLADSLHVADNVDIDGAFNADGATTLGSTLTVSGITTLNDSLQVNSSVDVTGDFNLGGELQSAALRADSSIAQGGTASNYFTTALGSLSNASGIGAVAAGYTASASGTQSAAIGTLASASGVNAVAIGESAQASAAQGVAVGKSAQVSGNYANVAVGVNSLVSAGWGNTAIGGGKVNATTGAPTYNIAMGTSTISTAGAFNVALGSNSTISGNGSTANSMTFGPYSTVDGGFRNMAFGYMASIGGASNSNYAMGDYSNVNGAAWHSYALGNYSKVQANGHHAMAFGPYSEVSAFNAANFAYKTPARFSHEAIFGAYADTTQMVPGGSSHNDWIGTDPLFVIANGATESSRSNALIIRKDGAALFMDSLHVAGNVSFAQTLTVEGATSLNDSLYVGGNTSLAGTLDVTGVTSLNDSLHVTGGADFDGDVNIDGTTSMTNTNISGNTTVGGTLTVNGETTLNDTLHASAPALFSDSIHVAGGASFAGTVDVTNLRIGGTTIPALDNTDALPEGDSNFYFTADREAALQAQLDLLDSVNVALNATLNNLLNQLFDPATVTTNAASPVAAYTASLNAIFTDGGAEVEASGFEISTNSDLSDSTVYDATGAGTLVEALTGLTKGTTYYYRAFVETIMGREDGAIQSFTTVDDAAVSTLSATSIGAFSANLRGQITSTGGGTISATNFQYSTNSSLSGASTVGGSSTSGTFNGSVSGLSAGTTYYFRARATNEAGTVNGATLNFTTIGLASVSTGNSSNVGPTTATLSGSVTGTGGGTVSATGFQYSTNASFSGASTKAGSSTSGSFTANLTGLNGSTTYYFRAYVTNEAGTQYGTSKSFTTQALGPCAGATTYTFDGHTYPLVESGGECWFGEDVQATSGMTATNLSNPDLSSTMTQYYATDNAGGTLYNQVAVNNNACPSGWGVPTLQEWSAVENSSVQYPSHDPDLGLTSCSISGGQTAVFNTGLGNNTQALASYWALSFGGFGAVTYETGFFCAFSGSNASIVATRLRCVKD